ncbi:acyl-CoA dehydrogenase family protein [Aeromicrobium fastidiosum]|uniref:Acyl-CoA dehydrogenase n=2 Tax=Aeromicrobium fastidiosum TaxID=52699 RepID=A0A641AVN7_9ACTN|nr:acyl-CoA dehydrogenase family protein [Aeromicrobium fastidiosum]KAA1380878.1 acyl-CoA dehydrogenase [Aeromicrobium fastidiosum]
MPRSVFTDEHDAFRAVIREALTTDVVPDYPSWRSSGMPSPTFWRRMGSLGVLGISVPAEHGGLPGSDFRHSAVVTEEIQRLGLAIGGLRVHTDICMPYLIEYGTPEQQATWLPRLCAGEAVIALGLSEAGAGSDLKAMATRAERVGDTYVVNGSKTFISNGAAADLVILAVKTDPSAGRDGISLLLVDTSTPGFETGKHLDKLGLAAQDLAELSFVDMHVPVTNLLGEENEGFRYLTANLAQERLSIAVNSQAAAVAALAWTVDELAGTRPGQEAKFTLAACATEVAAGQALVDQAIGAHLSGQLGVADAAAAKLFCTELQGRVVERCLDLHPAGTAFRADSTIGHAYLDGRVSRIYAGSSEIMKVIVSQQLGL